MGFDYSKYEDDNSVKLAITDVHDMFELYSECIIQMVDSHLYNHIQRYIINPLNNWCHYTPNELRNCGSGNAVIKLSDITNHFEISNEINDDLNFSYYLNYKFEAEALFDLWNNRVYKITVDIVRIDTNLLLNDKQSMAYMPNVILYEAIGRINASMNNPYNSFQINIK